MIVAIIFLLVGILLAVMIGIVISRSEEIEDLTLSLIFCSVLSIMFLFVGSFLMYQKGRNESIPVDEHYTILEVDNTYKRLGIIHTNKGIVMIVRRQDGKIFARKTKMIPAPWFKRVDDDKNPYQPYP